jgi:NAD(P)-dependent dehydrogenase (short-subunit alcohol dehydrogenase family)
MNGPTATWNFAGKVALVVGGTAGIGLAIAERLVASGAKVAVAARSQEGLDAFCAKWGPSTTSVRADSSDAAQVNDMIEKVVATFGHLDLAFNVAAGIRLAPIVDMAEEDWVAVQDQALRSVFLCLKHEAKQMIEQGTGGAIVNISSVSAHIPAHGASAYSSAKLAVEALTRTAALELAAHKIRVNALSPGLVATPFTEGMLAAPGVVDAYNERIAMNRPAQPDELAGPALFLASHEASYITGATLVADGGWGLTGYPDLRQFF